MSKMKYGYRITTSDGMREVVGPPVLRSALSEGKGNRFLIIKGNEVMAQGKFLGQGRDLGEVLRSIKAPRGVVIRSEGLGMAFKAQRRGVIVPA